jgi:hypothetical protein
MNEAAVITVRRLRKSQYPDESVNTMTGLWPVWMTRSTHGPVCGSDSDQQPLSSKQELMYDSYRSGQGGAGTHHVSLNIRFRRCHAAM